LEELKKHNSIDDLWVAIEGRVYNVTKFIEDHPGGDGVLMDNAGTDATHEFAAVGHSGEALELLKTFYIGDLAGAAPKPLEPPKSRAAPAKPAPTKPKSSPISSPTPAPANPGGSSLWVQLAIPVIVIIVGVAVRLYYS